MFSTIISVVHICDVTTLMGLKVQMEFGTSQKISKSRYVGPSLVNHAKCNFTKESHFTQIWVFTKNAIFHICSKCYIHVSEAGSATERVKLSLRKSSKPSKLSMV